ncbi:MAG: iron-sulfur cluster assembly accessory protein [Halieaceae bacterium]|nr:iron-sulfur cluster assembly accessory protein [Halieaceae bacterium]MCP5205129.1 iron-sulfur cluster assembly accessory protein [Pseudomonadales bacterium]
MSVQHFDVTQELVTVTPAAAEHFRSSLAGKGLAGVRISVRESGCTGFKYVLDEVAKAVSEDDVEVALENGVSLFLAPAAVAYLRGTQIDYAREGVNRSLKFNNPNVTAQCGCGESFSVE